LADVPVLVERVANLATLAEWQCDPRVQDFVCLHGGETGLGVGVVTSDRLLSGANGRAGGLLFADNIRVSTRLPRSKSSARLVAPPAEHLGFVELLNLVRGRNSTFAEESAELITRLDQGDHEVDTALDYFSDRLGRRLIALLELFDPTEVVFAGPLAPLADRVIPAVRGVLRGVPELPEPLLVAGGAGPEASLIGGALMLADRTFAGLETTAA
jgi:predicted NBD/HSP70 family sugar kinase